MLKISFFLALLHLLGKDQNYVVRLTSIDKAMTKSIFSHGWHIMTLNVLCFPSLPDKIAQLTIPKQLVEF